MNTNIKILLVEDDELILDSIATFLEAEGYNVDKCSDGDTALEKVYENTYSLAILDIMLPGANGHEILKELRKSNDTPVLMVSALSDEDTQLQAFNQLADDYVTKPFKMKLLLKRVEALLRRSGALANEIAFAGITLYPEDFRTTYQNKDIPLTLKEFEILLLLMQNQTRTISHETILSRVWSYDHDGLENTVHTHIKNLRAKLPLPIIKTVRGVGYRLETQEFS